MRIFIRILLIAAVLGGIATAAYKPVNDYLKKRNRPDFKLAEIGNGTIRLAINATGEIKPKLAVQIGSVVSGPIIEINADFNQPIKKQFVMARIDPEPFEAQVASCTTAAASALARAALGPRGGRAARVAWLVLALVLAIAFALAVALALALAAEPPEHRRLANTLHLVCLGAAEDGYDAA